jgi:hypothetical protein
MSDSLGRGPLIMGVTWALSGVCVLIVAARFYVRSSVNGKISSDDWFMLLALVGAGCSDPIPHDYVGGA